MFFRGSPAALVATLGALAGSFMVSYSSAKAEALAVPVPPGVMRRAERAVCLCLATAVTAGWQPWAATNGLPDWAGTVPVLVAVLLIAVVANISAIRRLRLLARGAARLPVVARLPAGPAEANDSEVPRELARESSA
jgi:CDP-diacylglycerol--glycerol-3-phosphate 3-phosphatidyltransferase